MKVLLYWRFHPSIVLEKETVGYGKQKVKRFKESIRNLVATTYGFDKEEVLSGKEPTCKKCPDMSR